MLWQSPGLGRITSPFGPRVLEGAVGNFHAGADLGTRRTMVFAAQDGVVRKIWQTERGAWVLDIRHADEDGRQVRTRYIHMFREEMAVEVGQHVLVGQCVGHSGASGTTAAHLHFEILVDGENVDPAPFLGARGAELGAPTAGPGTGPGPSTPTEEDDMFTDDDRAQMRETLALLKEQQIRNQRTLRPLWRADVLEQANKAAKPLLQLLQRLVTKDGA